MSRTINRELLAGFTDEVKSYLPQIRRSFAALNADPTRIEVLEEAHGLLHSIKGAGSMLGLSVFSHIAFLAEETIEEVAAGQREWAASSPVLERVLVLLESYLDALHAGSLRGRTILAEVVTSLRRLKSEPEAGDQAEIALLFGTDEDPVVGTQSDEPAVMAIATAPSAPARGDRTVGQIQSEYQKVPPDLLETFRQEAEETLHDVGNLLNQIESGGGDGRAMLEIRRHAHTLKGAASSVGLTTLSSLAHRMEDLLDAMTQGRTPFSPDIYNLLLATLDCIGDMAEAHNVADLGSRTQNLYSRYAALLDGPSEATAAAPASGSPPPIPVELMESFRAEAEEQLAKVADGLRTLEADPDDKQAMQEIRRTIHTLKGAANMIGLRSMSSLAHEAEYMLDAMYDGAVPPSPENLALLSAVAETLGDLAAAGGERREVLARSDELVERLGSITAPSAAPAALEPLETEKAIHIPQSAATSATDAAATRPSHYVRVPIERLDELVRLVSELLVNRSTFEQHLGSYSREVEELTRSTGRLKRIASRLDSDFEVSALRGGYGQLALRAVFTGRTNGEYKDFDALEFDRYTDFHLIARDLTEVSSDVGSAAGELSHRISDFDGHLNRLGRLTSEVQDKLMRMRMVPLSSLVTRLRRTVRVTSERWQKPVDLIIEGEQVELDKTVLEDIAAPLEHLLRNAVDHGIESASTRQVLGKPAVGQIRLRAYHEGTQVVIQVSDDGGGIEPDLLRHAAVRAHLYTEAEAAQLSPDTLYNLVFLPGFSTARTVSETSGRGVGMDVVKSTVGRMKGSTSIETESGRGTTFTIRLPMTMAIMRVLLVATNGETFAVPLSVVTHILRIEPEKIERVGNEMVVRMEGKVIPAVRLGEALHLPRPADTTLSCLPVLIVTLGARQVAFIVEHLLEAREVVVKTIGTLLQRVEGVIGATLMGNGSVVLIVNPSELAPGAEGSTNRRVDVPSAREIPDLRRAYHILIVDDSVSVRRVLSNLVRSRNWNPVTARDGAEALEIIDRATRPPDAILLDIEMPRMDGYEFLTSVRSNPAHKDLPVIMLTSRAGEKHRQKAFELGATDYLVKPYEDETLITVIRRVVREAQERAVQ